MKNVLITTAFIAGLLFTSCSYSSSTDNEKTMDQNGKEYTSSYICPMHCEGSGSDKEGKCPVCKMDYVKNPKHHMNGNQMMNEHMDHHCPMHPEITGHEGDTCSQCGMKLESSTTNNEE